MSNNNLVSTNQKSPPNKINDRNFIDTIEAYKDILSKNHNDIDAILGIGLAFEKINDYKNAALYYEKALGLKPEDSKTLHNLGRIYIFLDQSRDAEKKIKESLQISPSSEAAWCDLGLSQMLNKDFDSAELSFRNSIKLNPRFTTAYHNLAECYQQRFKYEEAIKMFLNALEINPNLENTIASLAETYADIFETEKALDTLNKHIAMNPQSVTCRQSRAIILLKEKEFNKGFHDYEWRLNPSSSNFIARPFAQKLWKGENEKSKTLLIWLEQGVGDEILSLNLVKYFSKKINNLLIECDPRLEKILRRSFKNIEIFSRVDAPSKKIKDTDFVCPIWSGAKFFDLDNKFETQKKPILKPDKLKEGFYREKYNKLGNGKKIIGISWFSGGNFSQLKTPPLESWKKLLSHEDIFFVSIQYNPSKKDLKVLDNFAPHGIYFDDSLDNINDIDEIAAQICSLDAVVTVSNTNAHLSGALGKPVGTIIPYSRGSFWYWFKNTEESAWYPSMTLFRQNSPGDWDSAIEKSINWVRKII